MTTELIGHCGVDSGQILLIDPCYVYDDDFRADTDPTGGPYDEACRITLSDKGAGETSHYGVVTRTAWGDGAYPVYAEKGRNGQILSVTIYFDDDPHNPEPELCEYCGDEVMDGDSLCWDCENGDDEDWDDDE